MSVCLGLAIFGIALITAGSASALLFNQWGTHASVQNTEVSTDDWPIKPILSHLDITNFWYANDGSTAYFRMDLLGAPGIGASAPEYMIYIDDVPGGDDPGAPGDYVAQNVSGADWIADAHINSVDASTVNHYHPYNAGDPVHQFDINDLSSVGGQYLQSAQTLEWSVPLTVFGDTTFTAWAATFNIGNQWTFDTAMLAGMDATPTDEGVVSIPEPGTLALALLVGGMGALMRRRTRKTG